MLAFSEAITDNMFAGLAADDYAAFSRDFDDDVYERAPGTEFSAWKEGLEEVIGAYLFRNVDKLAQSDEFYVLTYQATFEKEEQVTVTVAFHASDHSIAFLSFESEKYSWSAWE